MLATVSRAFPALTTIARSTATFGGSAKVQFRPRVGALPLASGSGGILSTTPPPQDPPAAAKSAAMGDVSESTEPPSIIVHGKLAAESEFDGLVDAVGTISAPGIRVAVYDDA